MTRTIRRICLLTAVAAVPVFLLPGTEYAVAQAGDLQKQKSELQQLKKQLEDKKKTASRLKSQEKDVLGKLNRVDRKLRDIDTQLRRLKREENKMSRAILDNERVIRDNESRLERLQGEFGQRMRQLYKQRRYGDLEWLLAAGSLTVFLRNLKYINRTARQNRLRYAEITGRKQKVEETRLSMLETLEDKKQAQADKKQLGQRYKKEKNERSSVLKTIRSKRSFHEAAIRQMEEQYREMQAIVDQLERARKGAHDGKPAFHTKFAQARGSMRWPVPGRVIEGFGKQKHPRYNTVTINKGIDISVRSGDPVRAVWEGKVAMVSWIRGYGKFLILDHGEGYYTLYAHLEEILVDKGVMVTRGEVVGRAGDTGSVSGTRLHFEVRKGKEVQDPVRWLQRK